MSRPVATASAKCKPRACWLPTANQHHCTKPRFAHYDPMAPLPPLPKHTARFRPGPCEALQNFLALETDCLEVINRVLHYVHGRARERATGAAQREKEDHWDEATLMAHSNAEAKQLAEERELAALEERVMLLLLSLLEGQKQSTLLQRVLSVTKFDTIVHRLEIAMNMQMDSNSLARLDGSDGPHGDNSTAARNGRFSRRSSSGFLPLRRSMSSGSFVGSMGAIGNKQRRQML